jgi:hypothetical protein
MNNNLEGVLSFPLNASNRLVAARIEQTFPCTFRVAECPDGRKIVQGAYRWSQGSEVGIFWRDLPLVKVNELGQEITV